MPTYEYRCTNCGYEFDLIQGIKSSPKRKCPKCGKLKLKRLISGGGGVIFKGEGFYRSVDYINQKSTEQGMLHTNRREHKESL